ncbi:MAG: hypothetical protein PHQ54_05240, partial [Candidatus Omnitrophica bacterium]|nr:hypothetical protein [Candidatus Omnitrophota bacterium]
DDVPGELVWSDAGGGYTNLTSFVDQTAWRLFYSNANGDVTELALGTDGQVLTSTGATSAPAFEDAAGGGGGAFEEVSSVVRQASADYDEDFVFGSTGLADTGNAIHDSRFFFDKSKGAFRAGRVGGSEWDSIADYSIALGYGAEITSVGSYAFIGGGDRNKISGREGAIIGGLQNEVTGRYSAIIGGNSSKVTGENSVAMCRDASAYLYSQVAHQSGAFSSDGDAQYSRVVLFADTTDATPEIMYQSNNSYYKLVVPAETAWRIDGVVIATTSDCGSSSSWTIKGVIHRNAANGTEVIWSNVTEDVDEIDTAASITLTANDTDEALNINITGKAATNIRWVAYVELAEVKY